MNNGRGIALQRFLHTRQLNSSSASDASTTDEQQFADAEATNPAPTVHKISWPHDKGPIEDSLNLVPAGSLSLARKLPKVCRPQQRYHRDYNVPNQHFTSGQPRPQRHHQEERPPRQPTSKFADNWDTKMVDDKSESDEKENLESSEKELIKRVDKVSINKPCKCTPKCDAFINCTHWLENMLSFDAAETTSRKPPCLFSEKQAKIAVSAEISDNFVLHAQIIPKPMTAVKESCFKEGLIEALKANNIFQPNKLQSYTWMAIMRQMNVFIIAPENSGKTLGYIPPLCAIANDSVDTSEMCFKYRGPVVLILCENKARCKQIVQQIDNIIQHFKEPPTVNLNESSLLRVATPEDFETDLKQSKTSIRRLYHLVLDRADCLFKTKSTSNLLTIFNKLQNQRPFIKNFQLILTSPTWTLDHENLLKALNIPPVLCFQDYLQAAIYSKCQITKKKFKYKIKKGYLIDITKNVSAYRKTVVFCNDDEIDELSEFLEINGVENLPAHSGMDVTMRAENEKVFATTRQGNHKVFLCSDQMFKQTHKVTDALQLVHYSLPDDLVEFRARFRSIVQNLKSPIQQEMGEIPNSCVIIDERSNNDLYSDFIVRIFSSSISSFLKLNF